MGEGDGLMGTEDRRREFDEIVEHLTADYPSLRRRMGPPWPRKVLVPVMLVGAVIWGLLSVAMVAWGWRGVLLTCATVAAAVAAVVIRTRRHLR